MFVRAMTHTRALFIGRHLWRLRYLGVSLVQVEAACFPSSHIPTEGKPVTREADTLSFPIGALSLDAAVDALGDLTGKGEEWCGEMKWRLGIHDIEEMREAKMSPRIWRQLQLGGDGPNGGLLIEGTRTNLAIWSEAKP